MNFTSISFIILYCINVAEYLPIHLTVASGHVAVSSWKVFKMWFLSFFHILFSSYSKITNFYVTLEWLPVYRQNEIIENKRFNILVLSVAKG